MSVSHIANLGSQSDNSHMQKRRHSLGLIVAAASALLAGAPLGVVQAEPIALAQSSGQSLEQAINSVKRRYGGRIVSAYTEVRGGREIHVVRVLTKEGNVKTVRVPGRSKGRG